MLDLDVQTQDSIGGLEISPDGTATGIRRRPPGAPSPGLSRPMSSRCRLADSSGDFWRAARACAGPRRQAHDLHQAGGLIWRHSAGRRCRWPEPARDRQAPRRAAYPLAAMVGGWPARLFQLRLSERQRRVTEIFRVAVDGGAPEPVVATTRRAVFPGAESGRPRPRSSRRIQTVSIRICGGGILQAGRNQRLTFGIGEYGAPAISADGRRLVATVSAAICQAIAASCYPIQPPAPSSNRSPTDTRATLIPAGPPTGPARLQFDALGPSEYLVGQSGSLETGALDKRGVH